MASLAMGVVTSQSLAVQASQVSVASVIPSSYPLPDDAGTTGSRLVTIAIVAGAIFTLGYLIWGGLDIITAGGDSSKVAAARNKIIFAVIGLLVLASSWAIFQLVIHIAFGSADPSIPKLSN